MKLKYFSNLSQSSHWADKKLLEVIEKFMIINNYRNIKKLDSECSEKHFKHIFYRCGIIEYARNIYISRYVLSVKKSLEKCVE